jgi:hypothetical protein
MLYTSVIRLIKCLDSFQWSIHKERPTRCSISSMKFSAHRRSRRRLLTLTSLASPCLTCLLFRCGSLRRRSLGSFVPCRGIRRLNLTGSRHTSCRWHGRLSNLMSCASTPGSFTQSMRQSWCCCRKLWTQLP